MNDVADPQETVPRPDDRGGQPAWKPSTGFTYKSGARPLEGYTIKRGLGWGGFGEVYYALSDGGKEVALKLVQRHLDIELRGVAVCLNLKHPNLVSLFDVRQSAAGENWVVMEYLAGESLQARLDTRKGPLPAEETLYWLDATAAAIDYLHQHGIVHRDLKPGNVFREDDAVKVGDYGLSKFISTSRRSGQTQSVGTVHYMAPEISTGNYGRGIDVYSIAVMAFEMLTGTMPFDGETTGEVLMKHLTAEPALGLLDKKYRELFAKALAKKPEMRHRSAKEFVAELRRIALPGQSPVPVVAAGTSGMQPAALYEPLRALDLKTSLPPIPGTFAARRRAASETLWTMFLAGLVSFVLPAFAQAAELLVAGDPLSFTEYLQGMLVTGVGAWGVLLLNRFWDAHRTDSSMRRFASFGWGLAVGAVALLLTWWQDGMLDGVAPAAYGQLVADNNETVLRFLAIFGLGFAIPNWAAAGSRLRKERFNLWRVIWAGIVTSLIGSMALDGTALSAHIPAFAVILAMTSATVQWVSPYQKRQRLALRRNRRIRGTAGPAELA